MLSRNLYENVPDQAFVEDLGRYVVKHNDVVIVMGKKSRMFLKPVFFLQPLLRLLMFFHSLRPLGSFTTFVTCLIFMSFPAKAEIPGTALSNERDALRLDLRGAYAFPSPGVGAGATVLWTVRPANAFGLATDGNMHDLDAEDAKISTRSLDLVWEHSVAMMAGFHALRLRLGAGVSRVHRTMDHRIADMSGKSAERLKWAPHIGGSVAFDFPVADLMWFRLGVSRERAILKETPTQGSIFIGWVAGGQWINIGE